LRSNTAGPAAISGALRDGTAELIGLAPELIVVNSTPALATLHAATTTIPVVVDPVGLGYIASLSHPGGNITGFTYMEVSLIGKWLDLLKGIAPEITAPRFFSIRTPLPFTRSFYAPLSPLLTRR
jgi:putative ABC transport system substrate-binding protein